MRNNRQIGLWAGLSLLLLLVSCDNNGLSDNELSGEEVVVQVRLLGIAEGDEMDVSRSDFREEVKEVLTPIGNGMVLEMSMERDTALLRAKPSVQLTTNAWFRVIAVKTGTSVYVSHGDFQVGGATSLAAFHVPGDGAKYDFICFSYNSTTSSSLPTGFSPARGADIGSQTLATSGTNDLLRQKLTNVTVNAASPLLSIQLEHALARIRVVVDCSYNEWTITSIASTLTLGSVANSGTVGLVSGTASGTTGNRAIAWTSIAPPTKPESDPILVIPQSGTLTVSIPANAIVRQTPLSSIPAATTTGTFSATLAPGSSYKLNVKLRAPIPAWSNIYWDAGAGKLTFVPASKDGSTNHSKEGYQGVLFRWGSLRAIGPDAVYPYDPTVYKPSGSGWTSEVIEELGFGVEYYPVPYWDTYYYGNVIDNTHTSDGIGDICQYLGTDPKLSGYRLPKLGEFGSSSQPYDYANDGWAFYGSVMNISSTVSSAGITDIIAAGGLYIKNTNLGISLPASGRDRSNAGTEGVYRLSEYTSPDAKAVAYDKYGTGNIGRVFFSSSCLLKYFVPVRCMKN
jgi:hypothetical protein